LRSAKQGHDAVTLGFVDNTIIKLHGFMHDLQRRLQAPHSEFGIAEGIYQAR
jgi:hypothetical protein